MSYLEELQALTDDELIVKLGGKLGFKVVKYKKKWCIEECEGNGYLGYSPWDPLNKMSNALPIWEKMGPGWQVSQSDAGGWSNDKRWWCWLPENQGGDGTIVMQPTPSRAICIAYILTRPQ